MTDQPKRRGRPRKAGPEGEIATAEKAMADILSVPTAHLRVKMPARYSMEGAFIQQAWQHPNGIQWRTLPVVSADAPDWEEG